MDYPTLLNEVLFLFFYWAIPMLIGAAVVVFIRWLRSQGNYFVCRIWDERNGEFYKLKEMHQSIGTETFTLKTKAGVREFLIDRESVTMYNDSHPIQDFILDKNRARKILLDGKEHEVIKSEKSSIRAPKGKDPQSLTAGFIYARKGLEQVVNAAKGRMDLGQVMPLIIMVGIVGLTVGYVIFNYWHPGLYPAPPPGYYYKAVPIPANATVVHG